jgi:hypothetical protein
MSGLTFFAEHGAVFMADGPWSARLSQTQTDVLLDLWDEVGAVTSFNRLYDAVVTAGYLPPVLSVRSLRGPVLVVDNTPDVAAHNFTHQMEQSL